MAILGSKRARDLLKELGDDAYIAARRQLRRRPEAANRRVRQTIRPGLEPQHVLVVAARSETAAGGVRRRLPGVHADEGVPHEVAQHRAGVVAQLRHDTILYAKQSYTMTMATSAPVPPKPVQGYVEPVPEFYARLLALSRMTNQGLTDMKVLDQEAKDRLNNFEKLLERLLAIVEKELDDKELTEPDYEFIRNIADQLKHVSVKPNQARIGELAQSTESDANARHCGTRLPSSRAAA